eukprot:353284-Chlamydomonas_euryale.AAC.8
MQLHTSSDSQWPTDSFSRRHAGQYPGREADASQAGGCCAPALARAPAPDWRPRQVWAGGRISMRSDRASHQSRVGRGRSSSRAPGPERNSATGDSDALATTAAATREGWRGPVRLATDGGAADQAGGWND